MKRISRSLVTLATATTIALGGTTVAAADIPNPAAAVPGSSNSVAPNNGSPLPPGTNLPAGPLRDLDESGYLDEALVALAVITGGIILVATLYNNGIINNTLPDPLQQFRR